MSNFFFQRGEKNSRSFRPPCALRWLRPYYYVWPARLPCGKRKMSQFSWHKKAIRTKRPFERTKGHSKLDETAQFASMTAAWTSSKTLRNVSTDTSPRPRGSLVCARLQVSSNSSEVISTPMLLKIRLICKKQQGTNMQETIRWNCWKCSNCVLRDK